MSTCPCCGERHTVRRPREARPHGAGAKPRHAPFAEASGPTAPATLWADDALIACCKRATDHAVLANRATAEVADLAIAIAANAAGRSALAARGIEATGLAHAAQAALEDHERDRAAARAGRDISADMIVVLERAESAARARAGTAVEVGDVVEILLKHSDDLAGARFLSGFGGRTGGDRTGTTRRPRAARPAHLAPEASPRLAPAPVERVAAVARDPFQIRTDAGDAGSEPEPSGHDAASTGFAEAASRAERAPPNDPAPPVAGSAVIDTEALRAIERQVGDVAAAQAECRAMIERLTAGTTELRQHITTLGTNLAGRDESRLDRLAAEVTALRDAFLELEARLRAARADMPAKPAADDPRLDRILERIADLEGLFARLPHGERAVSSDARDRTARSARLGPAQGPGRWRRLRRDRRKATDTRARRSDGTQFQTARGGRSDLNRGPGAADYDDAPEAAVAAFEADGSEGDPATKRFYLDVADDVVCAPSIGPRTAARLHAQGIMTVRDLLAADPADLATALASRYITSGTIEDWQMQARLVCTIPWLRGTHAQLLVGAGYTTAGDIAEAAGDALSADILKFAATRDGQRILRNGTPPPIERIRNWANFASMAEIDRAA